MELSNLSDIELLTYAKQLQEEIDDSYLIEQSLKTQLNSSYGVLTNEYFRYFDIRLGEAVTKTGQLITQTIINSVNSYLNKILKTNADYVVAGDTDSIIFTLEKVVNKYFPEDKRSDKQKICNFVDQFCKTALTPAVEKECEIVKDYLNCNEQLIKFKREAIADSALWTTKKHYIMNILDNEGVRYDEPKFKIKGIEAIKTSTPAACRVALKSCFKIVLNGTEKELQQEVKQFKKHFMQLPIEDIAFPKSVNQLSKYQDYKDIYSKGTGIHIKASLLHNNLIKQLKLERQYSYIKEGEKIKYVYLKEPNPLRDKVIAFQTKLPKEFELDEYVDWKLQFEKTFLVPLNSVLQFVNWTATKRRDLTTLFD